MGDGEKQCRNYKRGSKDTDSLINDEAICSKTKTPDRQNKAVCELAGPLYGPIDEFRTNLLCNSD